jgi:hypothetical protein
MKKHKPNIVEQRRKEKREKEVQELRKQKLLSLLTTFLEPVDAKAKEIIYDLVERLYPILGEERPVFADTGSDDAHAFMGTHANLFLSSISNEQGEILAEDMRNLHKEQFATFAETSAYCEGTAGLLELLMRYGQVKTETCTIMASPDANTYLGEKATFLGDDVYAYDDKRSVYVSILFKEGGMMFVFEESIKKNKLQKSFNKGKF